MSVGKGLGPSHLPRELPTPQQASGFQPPPPSLSVSGRPQGHTPTLSFFLNQAVRDYQCSSCPKDEDTEAQGGERMFSLPPTP